MGRPKLQPDIVKTTKITTRMTEEDAQALQWYAGLYGISVSEMIRTKLQPVILEALGVKGNG